MKSAEKVKSVELVREIRDRHYELLKDMTPEERRRYYREQAQRLHESLTETARGPET